MLACAFVAGLPATVKQLLRAGSRMDELPLAHILTRARAVLTDEVGVAAAVSAMTVGAGASVKRADATSELLCFQCNQPNHLARDCLLRRKNRGDSYGGRGRGAGRGSARCYRCDGLGHFASSCPGNENGGRPSALVSNPGILHVRAAALPVTNISVDDAICLALIDSGCSHCIVHAPYCASCTRKRVDVMTVSGERQRCEGVGCVKLRVGNGSSVVVDLYVVDFKPLGFDFILGINGISALGGVTILPSLATRFGSVNTEEKPVCAVATKVEKPVYAYAVATKVEKPVYAYAVATKVEKPVNAYAVATKLEKPVCSVATKGEKPVYAHAAATKAEKPVCAIEIDEPDFRASFDASEKVWTVTWKWSDDAEPHAMQNRVSEYSIPTSARLSYEAEIEEWITNGWLEPYDDETLGPAKGLIPLMAIIQQNKDKVRPVMDFRELNSHVDAFTASADVCADKKREWRRLGTNVAIVDFRRAYLQIRVHESLWSYQTVIFRGQRYCLTRLGFGLNVAPSVMKSVLTAVLAQDETVDRVTSSYLDDIFVNEDVVSVQCVENHLLRYGLECKPAERVADGARVSGLEVWGGGGEKSYVGSATTHSARFRTR